MGLQTINLQTEARQPFSNFENAIRKFCKCPRNKLNYYTKLYMKLVISHKKSTQRIMKHKLYHKLVPTTQAFKTPFNGATYNSWHTLRYVQAVEM